MLFCYSRNKSPAGDQLNFTISNGFICCRSVVYMANSALLRIEQIEDQYLKHALRSNSVPVLTTRLEFLRFFKCLCFLRALAIVAV